MFRWICPLCTSFRQPCLFFMDDYSPAFSPFLRVPRPLLRQPIAMLAISWRNSLLLWDRPHLPCTALAPTHRAFVILILIIVVVIIIFSNFRQDFSTCFRFAIFLITECEVQSIGQTQMVREPTYANASHTCRLQIPATDIFLYTVMCGGLLM